MFTEADGRQRLCAFSFAEAGLDALITLWEYDEQFKCMHKIKRNLPRAAFGFFHDMAVTENYYVFVENPTRMDFGKLLTQYTFGQACIAECLQFDKSLGVKVCVHNEHLLGQSIHLILSAVSSHSLQSIHLIIKSNWNNQGV